MSTRRRLVIAVPFACSLATGALAACDTSYKSSDTGGDASALDAIATDATVIDANGDAASDETDGGGDGGPACSTSAPFSTITPVAGLPGIYGTPHFSLDELTAYFSVMDDAGDYLIGVATRTSLTSSFGAPALLPSVDVVGSSEVNATPSANGLALYYASTSPSGPSNDTNIWLSTRTNTAASFSSGTPVAGLNSTAVDDYPYPDGLHNVYFGSTRAAPGYDLYFGEFGDASFLTPTPIAELNSSFDDIHPVITLDRLAMYFARNTTVGVESFTIFVATRASSGDTWSVPTAVAELASPLSSKPSWISSDRCRLYFTQLPEGGSLVNSFVATRSPN